MSFIKRIFLFMLVNILVMTTISIVTSMFGLTGYLTQAGTFKYFIVANKIACKY